MKMKKILIAFMIVMMSCSYSFAAENDDVYVRKDLFESYMKNIDSKLDIIMKEQALMREDIKNINSRLTALEARVSKFEAKADGLYVAISNRFDSVEKRFDVLFYLVIAFIGLIGVIFGLPVVQRWWEQRGDSKRKYLTAEDVERLIEAKMRGNLSNAAL